MDEKNHYEIRDGQVVSPMPIAIPTTKLSCDIIGDYEDLMVRWELAAGGRKTKDEFDKAKLRFEHELPAIARIIFELVENGYHILGVKDDRLDIAIETCPPAYKPIRTYPEPDDIEIVNGEDFSKKGLDGLGEMFGSRRKAVELVSGMVDNIRENVDYDEIPF